MSTAPMTDERLAEIERQTGEFYSGEEWPDITIRELIAEVKRLRMALGLKDGETLISGENGEFIAQTKTGSRYRANMMQAEMRELERLRSSLPAWHDRPTGPGMWVEEDTRDAWKIETHHMEQPLVVNWEFGRVYGPIPADSTEAGT